LLANFRKRQILLVKEIFLIGLIKGLLGDTTSGKVITFKKDFDYWMKKLGGRLAENTRWRKTKDGRSGDSKKSKFETPEQIREYLDCLTIQQEKYLAVLMNGIDRQDGLGFLNLMSSSYKKSRIFVNPAIQIGLRIYWGFFLHHVPEETRKVGVVC
jgi:hypothetical protein